MSATNQVIVSVQQDGKSWRVHLQKGPGVAWPQSHPILLTTEADALAKELQAAAAECRRRNQGVGRKWP